MEFYSIITGATGGLGNAFVLECAKRGDNLVLTGTNQAKLDAVVKQATELYPNAKILSKTCDLSSSESRDSFFKFLDENEVFVWPY